jgi:hypothetical protein
MIFFWLKDLIDELVKDSCEKKMCNQFRFIGQTSLSRIPFDGINQNRISFGVHYLSSYVHNQNNWK